MIVSSLSDTEQLDLQMSFDKGGRGLVSTNPGASLASRSAHLPTTNSPLPSSSATPLAECDPDEDEPYMEAPALGSSPPQSTLEARGQLWEPRERPPIDCPPKSYNDERILVQIKHL